MDLREIKLECNTAQERTVIMLVMDSKPRETQ
jgi:hypothetical protein